MLIRPRVAGDVPELEALARTVHRLDGYPPYMPDDDFRSFVASDDAVGSWVAVVNKDLVGHVAIHNGSSPVVVDLAAEVLGIPPSRCGVVARLLVAPGARRGGVGRQLLDRAELEARRRQLVPVLDVVERFDPAISLYERAGWTRLGTVDVNLPDGSHLREHVYTAPTSRNPNATAVLAAVPRRMQRHDTTRLLPPSGYPEFRCHRSGPEQHM